MARDHAVVAAGNLFARVIETPAVQDVLQSVEQGGVLSCASITEPAQPFIAALLHQKFPNRPLVVVTAGVKAQERVHQDLITWMNAASMAVTPLFYPSWEILPHESRLPHADVISERLESLLALSSFTGAKEPARACAPVLVTSVAALLQKTYPLGTIRKRTRALRKGDRIEPLDLIEWMEEQGYEPEAQVTQKGEIALRGGIVDVFPLTSPWPVRLEFFGDELESLRHFDPQTQMSREEITAISIPPGGELGILKRAVAQNSTATGAPVPQLATFLEYFPRQATLLLFEPEQLEIAAEDYERQVQADDPFFLSWADFKQSANDRGITLLELAESADVASGSGEVEWGSIPGGESELASKAGPVLVPSSEKHFARSEPERLSLPFSSMDAFRPLAERPPEAQIAEAQRREFFNQLHRWLRQDYAVYVFCNTDGERQRFSEIWDDYGLTSGETGSSAPKLEIGSLARGFLYEPAKVVVITDAEIFGRYKVQRPRRLKSPHAQATRSALDIDFTELEEGDYVVHLQHGIGRFLGLQVIPLGAGTKPTEGPAAKANEGQECLVLEYAAHDSAHPAPKLYVPVTEAHLVSKYVGTGKARPPLNTLGGTRWAKAKEHAERAVRDVASDLLSLQAARESQPGFPFPADVPWQREFESAFLYEETPDQMRAIVETKADMERAKPMDRLICGDVGFGKTEVGIRAAFKSVMSGKQVAVLVPTTVLAQQHYNTFRDRMADFPVRVELLSRFRTRREQQKVVADLASGAVDIVIGTHRLLQKDITFKDLGLVVIDEEQRFGVMHKEKFKMLRKLVDVLTLSATPIPRTLYLALTGARDMSTIQTPPHDRLPVETIATQYDERTIRDAIQRELNRGGQVFFLHNRVMTIHAMAEKLQRLVPHARLVVGHGQMDSDELEEVMAKFINGEADVLLSTTIIESGLDIPNANTIIIDRADRFGLSDLYQLRGRVGRYKHQAYAYLLLPRHGSLVADVRKRISAIKQYSTLGSGFKIAMRDLEIRGAGNLLGSEQSGHITAVGFELYCQLLKQSVSSLKGEKVAPRIEVQVRLDFLALRPGEDPGPESAGMAKESETPETRGSQREVRHHKESLCATAFIPFKYISDSKQRIDIYRKLAQATDKASLQALEKELRDRFGPVPPALQLLMQVADLKSFAAEKRITAIEVKEDKLMLTRNNDFIMAGSKFPRLTKKDAPGRLKEIRKLLGML